MMSLNRKWGTWTSPLGPKKVFGSMKNAPKKRRRSADDHNDNTRKRKHKGQMFLDFGQKNFEMRTCAQCDMVYAPGLASDELAHAQFCANNVRSLVIGARLCNVAVMNKYRVEVCEDGQTILRVPATDLVKCASSPFLSKVLAIKREAIDPSMGFLSQVKEEKDGTDPVSYSNHLFLCIDEKTKLVGLLCTERIVAGTHQLLSAPNHKPDEAVLGVLQIWVDASSRRKGIASRLLDAARQHSIYGYIIPREKLAFSQPTEDGNSLATTYIHPHPHVTVYMLPQNPEHYNKNT